MELCMLNMVNSNNPFHLFFGASSPLPPLLPLTSPLTYAFGLIYPLSVTSKLNVFIVQTPYPSYPTSPHCCAWHQSHKLMLTSDITSLSSVCWGLWADEGGLLPEEGGVGWRGGADRHSGHGRTGGLRCHQVNSGKETVNQRPWSGHVGCLKSARKPSIACMSHKLET